MKRRRWITVTLATVTLLAFALSLPRTWRYYLSRGEIYLFSTAFLEDLPKRLTGPGRLRFLIQPITAFSIGLGIGRARAGHALSTAASAAAPAVKAGRFDLRPVLDLILFGILLDTVAQRLILGVVHPVAALLVGPVLIVLPFTLGRSVAERAALREGAREARLRP